MRNTAVDVTSSKPMDGLIAVTAANHCLLRRSCKKGRGAILLFCLNTIREKLFLNKDILK
jgi:hypothetical protein